MLYILEHTHSYIEIVIKMVNGKSYIMLFILHICVQCNHATFYNSLEAKIVPNCIAIAATF